MAGLAKCLRSRGCPPLQAPSHRDTDSPDHRAWLSKLNPLVVVPVSILFGGLILAGREISLPASPSCCRASSLCLISSEVLLRLPRHIRTGKQALSHGLDRDSQAGVASARCCCRHVGEILAQRSGVMNLGVEA